MQSSKVRSSSSATASLFLTQFLLPAASDEDPPDDRRPPSPSRSSSPMDKAKDEKESVLPVDTSAQLENREEEVEEEREDDAEAEDADGSVDSSSRAGSAAPSQPEASVPQVTSHSPSSARPALSATTRPTPKPLPRKPAPSTVVSNPSVDKDGASPAEEEDIDQLDNEPADIPLVPFHWHKAWNNAYYRHFKLHNGEQFPAWKHWYRVTRVVDAGGLYVSFSPLAPSPLLTSLDPPFQKLPPSEYCAECVHSKVECILPVGILPNLNVKCARCRSTKGGCSFSTPENAANLPARLRIPDLPIPSGTIDSTDDEGASDDASPAIAKRRRRKTVAYRDPDDDEVEILPSDTPLPASKNKRASSSLVCPPELKESFELAATLQRQADSIPLSEGGALHAVLGLQAAYNIHFTKVQECEAQIKTWKDTRARAAAHVDDLSFRINALSPVLRRLRDEVSTRSTAPATIIQAPRASTSSTTNPPVDKIKREKGEDKGKGVDPRERAGPASTKRSLPHDGTQESPEPKRRRVSSSTVPSALPGRPFSSANTPSLKQKKKKVTRQGE